MAGLQSGESCLMIDSVVWAQYITVTDRHTDSHVVTAIAALMQHVSGSKNIGSPCRRSRTLVNAHKAHFSEAFLTTAV